MTINPGGEVPAYGREKEQERLWRILATRSALLLGERRTGKTTLIKSMKSIPLAGFQGVFRDYASYDSAAAFVEALADDLKASLSATTNAQTWLQDCWGALGGAEIGGLFRLPEGKSREWRPFLERLIESLEKNLPENTKFVFYWDEFPILIHKISRNSPTEAMDLLDALRVVRQRPQTPIRMVFTGSIGLHHVLKGLQEAGSTNSPVNDMEPMSLKPLSEALAIGLGEQLLFSANLKHSSEVPEALAAASDGLPFFIHRICAELQEKDAGTLTADDVIQVRKQLIADPADPMKLRWYEERIETYYEARTSLAFALLDALATAEGPLPFAELVNLARHAQPTVADNEVRTTLRHLIQDHYLLEEAGRFWFQFSIIRDGWRCLRYLS